MLSRLSQWLPHPIVALPAPKRKLILSVSVFVLVVLGLLGVHHSRQSVTTTSVQQETVTCNSNGTVAARSKFAYVLYATNEEYLCNAVLNFRRLKRLGVDADLVLIHPHKWDSWRTWLRGEQSALLKSLLRQAVEKYGVRLHGIDPIEQPQGDATWKWSLTKLYVFGMTEYQRIVYFDTDGLVLMNLDHLFQYNHRSPLVLPRAYWLDPPKLASHIMVVRPAETLWKNITDYLDTKPAYQFDMDVINVLFSEIADTLPHREYAMITGEFRSKDPKHSTYFSDQKAFDLDWDPRGELAMSHYIHFSDWPVPKPWNARLEDWSKEMPKGGEDREVWKSVYNMYKKEREEVCVL